MFQLFYFSLFKLRLKCRLRIILIRGLCILVVIRLQRGGEYTLKRRCVKMNFLRDPQHLLLRTGINHHLNPNIVLTAGYCFVETHPYGEFAVKSNFSEHRFWEQIQYKTQWSKMEWISRMRLEQRFSQLPIQSGESFEAGDAIYTNRVRILNRFSIPLKGDKIADKSLYLSIYDEFMINFGENLTKNIFDQNSAYIALGYKLPKVGHVEFGYLNQLVLRPNGYKQEINHNLQFSLNSTLGF